VGGGVRGWGGGAGVELRMHTHSHTHTPQGLIWTLLRLSLGKLPWEHGKATPASMLLHKLRLSSEGIVSWCGCGCGCLCVGVGVHTHTDTHTHTHTHNACVCVCVYI
jgi:hypothetical protein